MELKFPLILDFDSTIVQVEALDELAAIALAGQSNRAEIVAKIKDITNRGMDGSLSIEESLTERLKILGAKRSHLPKLIKFLKSSISPSFKRNKAFLKRNADKIFIFTSGFKEYVAPVIAELGLKREHVYANAFVFSKTGEIVGFDRKSFLCRERGKVLQLEALKFKQPVYVIGDGYTDYQIKESGNVKKFFAFTENVEREIVIKCADRVVKSFDEFLFAERLPMKLSYPKSKITVLLLENIHPRAVEILEEEGYSVQTVKEAYDEQELAKKIKGISLLGIRSKTKITQQVLANADKLLGAGAFCIGTDQMDLDAMAQKGVIAFNAPYSNTRSVVELAIGEIILLMRKTFEASSALHAGKWIKSADGCFEVRGKKLGIIGYGNIGSQLSVLAESLGMEVYYYDVVEKLALGNAKRCRSLAELLKTADIVTLHVDGRASNKGIFGAKEFGLLKNGAIFLNLSRGHIVDIEALADAVKSGRVGGAAVDVFPYEPKSNKEEFLSPLRGLPNLILTPHVGGSTEEAQRNIGEFVASRMIEYVNTGSSFGSVNFPQLQLPSLTGAHRLLHVHRNVPGILAKINSLLAAHKINILGQYLKTNEQIGYVITDVDKKYDATVISKLKEIQDTIKFRILY